MDGAITEAVHNPPVSSPRLCAGKRPDPNGRGEWMGAQRYCCKGTPRGALLCPCPGQEGPQRVPEPFASPPLPQHHSQACISAHHRARLLLSGAPLGNRGQWGGGCPPAGAPAHGHPKGWVEGPMVALCPCHPPLPAVPWGLAGNRAQLPPMSPQRDRPVPPPSLSGVPAPRRLYRLGGRCRGPACHSPAVASIPSGSLRTYGLSWPHGSVLGRVPDWGSHSCSPSGSIHPPSPAPLAQGARSTRPVLAGATASQPGLPRTTGTTAPVKH